MTLLINNTNDIKTIIAAVLALFFSSGQLYAEPAEEKQIETVSFCTAKADDCSLFGMDSQTTEKSVGINNCSRANEILCRPPEKPFMGTISDTNHQFNVLTYNIFNRPFIVSHDGQSERTCRIPKLIFKQIGKHHNIDVIVIQEAFTEGCRSGAGLRKQLAYYGWPYSTATVDKSTSPSNGGVFIASKWPITFTEQDIFSNCTGSDCLAAKGVLYARINKQVTPQHATITYNIFATHLNAWEGEKQAKVRLQQAEQMLVFISKQNIPKTEAVIIAGDLNINKLGNEISQSEVLQVLGALHAVMPKIVGNQISTADPTQSPLAIGYGTEPQWLDYLLYANQYLKPIKSSIQSIPLQTAKPFKVCMSTPLLPLYVYPDSIWCSKTANLIDLSDHYPVLGQFKY